jgi:competence protein ComEA
VEQVMTLRSIFRLSLAGTGLAVTAVLLFASSRGASAQSQLPEGPGKDAVVRMCGTCHPVERAASVRLTRAGWQDTIGKMMTLGAKGSDDDVKAVLEYLSTHFKGEAGKPLNLNTATSIDLESITLFLRKESAAWIAYRAKNGPCKTIDDLKKVPGVDFKKIDERRERLVCF